ncbi:hypothetical protein [Desulfopila aestuarii]|uniref:Dienelactone hydrolase n=1 Tax=Desulfopila aestuarii DSM 18488 TaxID=1121416 RepID=A0A1M7Y4S9_9BACT|nr:hypothetical protein [Desulfopila aestuarii]SHO47195.1 hypothetical protein SAMN02745220_01778 [Desulfopila aestuarii DSM 18488]
MHLLAATDIFGNTTCIHKLLTSLSEKYSSIEIIDPYDGKEIDFRNESDAYEYFQKNIGLTGYIEKIFQHLQANRTYCEQHLLGFSVGGSAIWAVSAMLDFERNTKGICFYSSQIRNLLHIQPRIPIDLYLPKMEPHFNIDEVMEALATTPLVNYFKTPYLHGFMNQKSVNFNRDGYSQYLEILRNA